MPVCIGPGPTAFTVIPSSPNSTASERVNPTTPCFAAVYADAVAEPPPLRWRKYLLFAGFLTFADKARLLVLF